MDAAVFPGMSIKQIMTIKKIATWQLYCALPLSLIASLLTFKYMWIWKPYFLIIFVILMIAFPLLHCIANHSVVVQYPIIVSCMMVCQVAYHITSTMVLVLGMSWLNRCWLVAGQRWKETRDRGSGRRGGGDGREGRRRKAANHRSVAK